MRFKQYEFLSETAPVTAANAFCINLIGVAVLAFFFSSSTKKIHHTDFFSGGLKTFPAMEMQLSFSVVSNQFTSNTIIKYLYDTAKHGAAINENHN
ncbi:hypothetical protein ACJX0J_035759, partial [Zea mays]